MSNFKSMPTHSHLWDTITQTGYGIGFWIQNVNEHFELYLEFWIEICKVDFGYEFEVVMDQLEVFLLRVECKQRHLATFYPMNYEIKTLLNRMIAEGLISFYSKYNKELKG